MDGIKISNQEYRASEGLSATDLKDILRSPIRFKEGIRKSIGESAQARMDLGSAIHCLIIEPETFEDTFFVMPDLNLRTKADREERDRLLEVHSDKTLITASAYLQAKEVAESVCSTHIGNLFKNGYGEYSYYSTIDGVKVKCRPDFYFKDKGLIIDLKTTKEFGATPEEFSRTATHLQYYLQASLYLKITGAKKFIFVAVEIEPPYCIGIYELDSYALELGDKEIAQALEIYKNLDKYTRIVSTDLSQENGSQVRTLKLMNYAYYKDTNFTL